MVIDNQAPSQQYHDVWLVSKCIHFSIVCFTLPSINICEGCDVYKTALLPHPCSMIPFSINQKNLFKAYGIFFYCNNFL